MGMNKQNFSPWHNWQYDAPAALVVLLVALPLCLGIALVVGAPLFSGVIAGIVGGLIVATLSGSPLSVSGPSAGYAVIVIGAMQQLQAFNIFLLAVCLAGGLQIIFGLLRIGKIADFIPSTVIKGMLAAIGIILILKQIPHLVGYEASPEGDSNFWQANGENTFSSLYEIFEHHLSLGAIIISTLSLIFLFWWDRQQSKFTNALRFVPGSLLVVLFGVAANQLFIHFSPAVWPDLAIAGEHLVSVPVASSLADFLQQFTLPNFTQMNNQAVWLAALSIALVTSMEALLSVEAIDKLDPFKRITPTNRELIAQGVGNICSGLIGGLPVTSVIVRSSANIATGGRTKMAAILHGAMLLGFVIVIPHWLNMIPLASLAAILIAVGYKLTKPAVFLQKYQKGLAYFLPFVVTITAILLTNLLVGIGIGVVAAIIFLVRENFRLAILHLADGSNHLVRAKKDLFFMHKYELKHVLNKIPAHTSLLLDLSRANFVDLDNIEIINDFIASAQFKNIGVTIKNSPDSNLPINGATHATL